MAQFTQWVQQKKNRKWLYVFGGLFLVIVLFMLLRGGGKSAGSGAGTVVQTGPSEAQLGAQLQSQEIQLGYAAAAMNTQAALEAEKLHSANEALSINASLQALNIQAQAADREGERALDKSLASISAERDVALQGITSQQMMHQATVEAGVAREAIAAKSVADQQTLFLQGQVALQESRNAVDIAAINAQRDLGLAHEQNISYGLEKAKKKHVGAILAGESPQLGTKTGAILGAIGGIFSDIRKKRNVTPTGARIDGIPSYTFEFVGAPGMYAGVIAQELEMMAPQFVMHTPRGLLVDYTAMDAAA